MSPAWRTLVSGGPGRRFGGVSGLQTYSIMKLTIVLYLSIRNLMEDIDPKLLRAFLHVAREGSVSAAARTLGLPPGTVSVRVRTLEKRLGTRLFERSGRGRDPGPCGCEPAAGCPGNRRVARPLRRTRRRPQRESPIAAPAGAGPTPRPACLSPAPHAPGAPVSPARPRSAPIRHPREGGGPAMAPPAQNWRTKLSSARLRS